MAGRRRTAFLARSKAPAGPPAPVDPAFALRRAGTALYTWHLADDALVWSPNAFEVLGLADAGLPASGRAFSGLIEPGGLDPAGQLLTSDEVDVGEGIPYRRRYALRIKPDRLLVVEDSGRWFADAQGRPAVLRGALRAEARCALDEPVCGFKVRAALLRQIFDDVRDAQRSRRAVTLVVGHIDRAGEPADELMAAIALRIRPLMRRRDRFVAYAPDRFALALSSCPLAEAEHAAARVARLVAEPCLKLGAATAPDHALDAPELLRRAEDALSGRHGGPFVYAAGRASGPERRAGTSPAEIVDALNGRRLAAGYHPALDAQTRRPMFASLTPLIVKPGGPVALGDLEAASLWGGIAVLVEARLVELAAERLARRPEDRVALAVSAQALHDRDWLDALAAHLGARPGIESRLIVSVHEAALREPATRGRLNALKALGVGVMLRGFGGGHAGLRMLKTLPIDILCIEGALVQNLPRSTDDRLLVRSLIDLAEHLGIATMAEWVEDETSARLLTDWGVDYIEGPLAGAAVLSDEPGLPRGACAAA